MHIEIALAFAALATSLACGWTVYRMQAATATAAPATAAPAGGAAPRSPATAPVDEMRRINQAMLADASAASEAAKRSLEIVRRGVR